MDSESTPENVEQDIANIIVKFKEDITVKYHFYFENEKKKLKQWEDKLQEQQRKIEEKSNTELAEKERQLKERISALDKREATLKEKEKTVQKKELQLNQMQKELSMKLENQEKKEDALRNDEESDIIHLNVGGWKFTTSLSTLRSEQGSMLEKMFSGQFPIRKEKDGSIFIDRSGSFFDFILDYLRGNMVAVDDLYFDDNTRKRLIKEAEYYQLEGMKNILAFKSNEVRVDDDCKQEIVEIIENVVQRKDHIRNVLNYSEKRNVNDGQLLSGSDLCSYYGFQHCSYHNCVVEKKYKTNKDEVFRNKRWDGVKFDHVVFKHNITFKNCSFLKAIFFHCEFTSNAVISFHECDLFDTDFSTANFNGEIHFDGSDIRFTNFSNHSDIDSDIKNGKITFYNVCYADNAIFDSNSTRIIIELINK